MLRLPNLEKSANLLIYFNGKRLVSKLAYSDYDISRHYILSDVLYPINEELSVDYLRGYINALEKKWDWQFYRNNSDQIMPFVNEGFGIDGITVHIDVRGISRQRYVDVIREVSKDISIVYVDDSAIQDTLMGIANKLGYDDILLLDSDLESTHLYRLNRDTQAKRLNEPNSRGYQFRHGKVQMGNEWRVIDLAQNNKLKAFLQYEAGSSRMSNLWANYVLGQREQSTSTLVKDILRSYALLQNLTIRNDNKGVFEGVGQVKYSTLVIVTGRIVNSISYSNLLLTIIDGLEVRDSVDIAVDKQHSIYTLGKAYANGIAKSGFLVEFGDFIKRLDQIIVPDVAKVGNKKRIIFNGISRSTVNESTDVYALSDEITQILFNKDAPLQEVSGRFMNNSSIYSEFNYEIIVGKKRYSSLIIDARQRPIVYGPEPKVNANKMSQWFNATLN